MKDVLGKLKTASKMAMPFVNKATDLMKESYDSVAYKNLLDSIIGSCAMVIRSDSEKADDNEWLKLELFIKTHDSLSSFQPEKVKQRFESYLTRFEVDPSIGNASVMETIGKLKNKEVDGKLVIRVAISVCTATKKLSDKRKKTITSLCSELGLEIKDFDLEVEVSAPKIPQYIIDKEKKEEMNKESDVLDKVDTNKAEKNNEPSLSDEKP
ncbi:MAG: hypothetical protein QM500_02015 [Methylococcales bacterium]